MFFDLPTIDRYRARFVVRRSVYENPQTRIKWDSDKSNSKIALYQGYGEDYAEWDIFYAVAHMLADVTHSKIYSWTII